MTSPAECETDELPHGIEAETAGHDRVILKMAFKKPQVRFYIELGLDLAFAKSATGL
jgi:hypothetical protein